jgi:CheY-like chemotaxis protein
VTHKLLLADDSITIQRVIELTFAGEDVDVRSVGDGEQAVEQVQSERPDIVLADIAMPKRNGYDVAAYVRSQPELAHVPVLLLAGAFEPVDQARAEAVQADGVLVKPFEPQQVVARVRELLRRGTSARRAISTTAIEQPVRPAEAPAASVPVSLTAVAEPSTPPEPTAPEPPPAVSEIEAPAAPLDVTPPALGADAPQSEPEAPPMPVSPPLSAAPDPPPPDKPADERPAASTRPARPSAAAGAAVDEFFGRLGSAVASLGSARPSRAPATPPPTDDPWTYGEVPTVSGLLDQPSADWTSADPPGETFARDRRTGAAGDAFAVDRVGDERRAPSRAIRRDPPRNVIAEAFHALLAAEQGRPRAMEPIPVAFTSPAPALELTDELVDRVTQRVLERLLPHAAREMVASIVSDVAERLVREELARVKARVDSRS